MRRRPESTALQIVRDSVPTPSPHSMIARARQFAPSATTVTAYPLEEVRGPRHSYRGQSLTAAAELMNGTETRNGRQVPRQRKRQAEQWQKEVWALRNESPEMRFLADRKARAVSQCRVYIGHHKAGDVGDPKRVDEGPVAELAQMLFGNLPDVEQKLKRYAQHVEHNGESIFNARDDDDHPGRVQWQVHSSDEVLGSRAGQYQITDGVSPRRVDDDVEILARSWTPSPQYLALADAPVRALLPVLRELVQMTKYVGAQIDSKLASGGGVLLVASDVQLFDKDGIALNFADELQSYMMTAIEDRASAESLAPLVAQVPWIEGRPMSEVAHLLTFSETLDPHMHERRAEAIRRIALGMDSDPGVLDGAGGMNHWSAWSLDESEVKLGVAPIMTTFCHTMTADIVRPLLAAAGVINADEFSVWFDTSALKLRPDRSKDAQWAYDQRILSAEKTLAEMGFDAEDMPTPAERAARVLLENLVPLLSQFGQQPGAAVEILRSLGVDIPATTVPDEPVTPPDGATPPPPAVAERPDNSPPDTQNDPPPAGA
ncbi:portal protein [Gordonia phage Leonard]|uniref:Portal protein n=1 Tax=Gordonia phage Leonard TaxID=2656539 RepID=A0A649VMS0_9CAUD|nr:portal protein [Gordonia phage Phinally]YP_010002232.1 portal protein [Gordonia phage Leonard]AMS03005.1 portal protein [Gordonia phage Phinally]QGJ93375.1 portal protein [Gordonia phage Leonard]